MSLARACITGTGMSDIGRNTGRPAMLHLAEAADRAHTQSDLPCHVTPANRMAYSRSGPADDAHDPALDLGKAGIDVKGL